MKPFHDLFPAVAYLRNDYPIVNTPSHIVMQIFNQYPVETFKNKDWKWLCFFSKNGAFELELFRRLMTCLAEEIPDENERRDWIITNMIWSMCPSDGCCSLTKGTLLNRAFKTTVGGWREIKIDHNVVKQDFLKVEMNKAGELMATKSSGEKKFVKFDVIVGNPPYQKTSSDRSGSNAVALYPDFVNKAIECMPKYISMVIPAKWMTGDGQGTSKFLRSMIDNTHLSKIVLTENASEWFPDIDLKGGAMFFLIDASKKDGHTAINGIETDLSELDVIIANQQDLGLIRKALLGSTKTFDKLVFGLCPYDIPTNHSEWSNDKDNSYVCYYNDGSKIRGATKLISKVLIDKNLDTIPQWKICTAKTSGKGKDGIGETFIAEPGSVFTHTYVLLASFVSKQEADNADIYLNSRFAQYMMSIVKGSINVSKKVFQFVPVLDFSRSYTDQDLYTMFNLSAEEIAHIETTTANFPIFRKAKKTKIAKSA